MPEQLEILKSRMAWKQMTEQSIQEGGFGLQNVQQRLQLVYGTKAGLHIESERRKAPDHGSDSGYNKNTFRKGRECLIWKKQDRFR